MIRKTIAALALAAAAGLALSGCNSHQGAAPRHSAAAAASSLAADPVVSADAQQAAELVKPCFKAGATYSTAKACISAKVPGPKRRALLGCLAGAYARDSGWTAAGWAAWKTKGAQPCVQAALR